MSTITSPTFASFTVPGLPSVGSNTATTGFISSANTELQGLVGQVGDTSLGSILGSPVAAGNAIGGAVNSVTGALNSLSGSTSAASSIDWVGLFLRATVIIMGFIFVAVGLSMFKNPVESVTQTTSRIGRKVIKGK